eukprot:11302377-Heterocapsa_arctica.AAC.1
MAKGILKYSKRSPSRPCCQWKGCRGRRRSPGVLWRGIRSRGNNLTRGQSRPSRPRELLESVPIGTRQRTARNCSKPHDQLEDLLKR